MKTRYYLSLSLVVALAACGDDDPTGPDTDTGADVGVTDTGADTPIEDTPMEDTPMADTGADTPMEDTPMEDTPPEDTGEDVEPGPTPRGPEGAPELGTQIDRAGRPAISSALVGTFDGDGDSQGATKDSYNAAGAAEWSGFADEIAANLAILDSLDAVCGNQLLASDENEDGRYAALAGILADDQLYVHSERGECGVYLGLEAEIVGAVEEGDGGCGGRTLSDDVIDRSYSVLAAGILTGVDDTITANDVEFLDSFPYLAAPHGE